MNSFTSIRQFFYGIVVISCAMTLFTYKWLDKYYQQKQKIQLGAITAFEQNFGRPPISNDLAFLPNDLPHHYDNHELYSQDIESPVPEARQKLENEIETIETGIDADDQEQLKLPENNELPWEEIQAANEEKKSQLSFDKPQEEEEKPFWEIDDKAGSPVKPLKKDSEKDENPSWEESRDSISWEEPEHIIKDFNTIKGYSLSCLLVYMDLT